MLGADFTVFINKVRRSRSSFITKNGLEKVMEREIRACDAMLDV